MGGGSEMKQSIVSMGESHVVALHVTSGYKMEKWRERRGSNP